MTQEAIVRYPEAIIQERGFVMVKDYGAVREFETRMHSWKFDIFKAHIASSPTLFRPELSSAIAAGRGSIMPTLNIVEVSIYEGIVTPGPAIKKGQWDFIVVARQIVKGAKPVDRIVMKRELAERPFTTSDIFSWDAHKLDPKDPMRDFGKVAAAVDTVNFRREPGIADYKLFVATRQLSFRAMPANDDEGFENIATREARIQRVAAAAIVRM